MAKRSNAGEEKSKRLLPAILGAVALTYLAIAFTPLRQTIPGYPSAETRRAAVENLIKVDSLENILDSWAFQVANIQQIVTGQAPREMDSVRRYPFRSTLDSGRRAMVAANDSLLREAVRRQERLRNEGLHRSVPPEGMHFFPPLKGVVTHPFSAAPEEAHTDISAESGSLVYAVADGTVISSQWNDLNRHTLIIQHENQLVSIYRHCEKTLKEAGTRVTAGTPVALVGTRAGGSYLHFELWHDGKSVDPALYIKF